MNDTSQQVLPPQENPPTPAPAPSVHPTSQPQKSKKNIWVIAGIVISALCLCSVACVAVFGTGLFQVYKERAPIESVLDAYMIAMENKDAKSAYTLFSPRAQRQIEVSTVQEMLEGNNYFLFEDYQSLSVTNINISAAANTNPDFPQGVVAKVNGVISYEDDIQGSFNAVLEKVDDKWMIHGINVTVPPSKIK